MAACTTPRYLYVSLSRSDSAMVSSPTWIEHPSSGFPPLTCSMAHWAGLRFTLMSSPTPHTVDTRVVTSFVDSRRVHVPRVIDCQLGVSPADSVSQRQSVELKTDGFSALKPVNIFMTWGSPRASLYVKCVGYSEGCVPPACVDSKEV